MERLYGGIEAGGTNFVCAVGTDPDNLIAEIEYRTTTPQETIDRAIDFFKESADQAPLASIGIASFGPLDRAAGIITTTPKPGWRNTDLAGRIRRALGLPVAIDTDVNGAALAEHHWGAASGLDTFVYLTVGTGIGGGGMAGGSLMHGLLHPEMGHIRIPRDPAADPYAGSCGYHGTCLEGLASGPALEARWGQRAEDLPDDHPAWPLEAHYLALGLVNFTLTLSPQRIVVGGGVMNQQRLYPLIRTEVLALLNGYMQVPAIVSQMDAYIVPPSLGDKAGVLGAIALARHVVE
jgi:fructokinase